MLRRLAYMIGFDVGCAELYATTAHGLAQRCGAMLTMHSARIKALEDTLDELSLRGAFVQRAWQTECRNKYAKVHREMCKERNADS